MKNGICTIVGVVGSFIASLFGGWDTALVTLMIFMAVDYITGLVVAGVFHKSPKTDGGTLESGRVEGPLPQRHDPPGRAGSLPPGSDHGV